MAGEIARRSPLAVVGTKATLTHARDNSVAAGLQFVALVRVIVELSFLASGAPPYPMWLFCIVQRTDCLIVWSTAECRYSD